MESEFVIKLKQFLADVRAKSQGGLTLQEIGQIFYGFILLAVSLGTDLSNPGVDKKAFVMSYASQLFDLLWPVIPLPGLLAWIKPFVGGTVKQLFMELVSGAIEAAYTWIKRNPPVAA